MKAEGRKIPKLLIFFGIILLIFGLLAIFYRVDFVNFLKRDDSPASPNVDQTIRGQTQDEVINSFLKRKIGVTSSGGEVFCAYDILGKRILTVDAFREGFREAREIEEDYLWVLCQEFYVSRDNDFKRPQLKPGTMSSLPADLSIKIYPRENNLFELTDYKLPGDGSEYPKSIREIFPKEYQEKIFNYSKGKTGLLELEIRNLRQAQRFFKDAYSGEAYINNNGKWLYLSDKMKFSWECPLDFRVGGDTPLDYNTFRDGLIAGCRGTISNKAEMSLSVVSWTKFTEELWGENMDFDKYIKNEVEIAKKTAPQFKQEEALLDSQPAVKITYTADLGGGERREFIEIYARRAERMYVITALVRSYNIRDEQPDQKQKAEYLSIINGIISSFKFVNE
jgi:hypothetical protein